MTSVATRELSARIVHALGDAAGALPVREAVAAGDATGWDDALAELVDHELVSVGSDGMLRRGARGSPLAAADVAARLTTLTLGRPVEVLAVCGSTNDVVLRSAAEGARPGLVVCAELQTQGRGRRGRVFDSRPGLGLWSTTLLPAPDDPATAPRLSLLAGLAACAAIEDVASLQATVKWPNDVRIRGRKVCGVLVEARSAGRRLFPVAGIGINVHHRAEDFPPELRDLATSVESAAGIRVERAVLLATLLARLEELLDAERGGAFDLAAAFARRDETLGRDVVVETDGLEQRGTGAGVAEDGALLLDVPGRGTVPVRAGEASVRAIA